VVVSALPDAFALPDLAGMTPGQARAAVALSQLGATETRQNRGPQVDRYIRGAGGSPSKAPPWCAYFVTWCGMQVHAGGIDIERVVGGAARSHWQRASPALRIERGDIRDFVTSGVDLTGAVFVRARTKAPKKREAILAGRASQGHTGIVVGAGIDEQDRVALACVAGNSSGAGHSHNSGMVARELIVEGSRAWDALVGVVLP